MKRLLIILCLLVAVFPVNAQTALMPMPQSLEKTTGAFRLTDDFSVSISGPKIASLEKYTTRFIARLSARMAHYLQNAKPYKNAQNSALQIVVNRQSEIELGMDESYSLEVLPAGIMLEAETQVGAMRGLETLLQLLAADKDGFYIQGYRVKDEPRFAWRGLLLDVCRHWMPMEVVKRNIDAMAAVKLNVLHLHLTEDQGFRIESKRYPKLHELGSDGDYFTQEEISKIVNYAKERGIRVVPEFDIPGHATSWFVGYPELASAPGPYQIEDKFGVHDPTMDPTKSSTYEFLGNFLEEMAGLFPDQFMHIGGDENNGRQWDANPSIQKFMNEYGLENNHQLQAYFNKRISDILTKQNKRMVGWDEILDEDLPKTIVIQSWRGKEALIEAAENGYDGLLSNGYYIDLVQSTAYHYRNDPLPDEIRISDEARKHVLGGEATMWSEIVSPETVDSRIWPRTAAIAERFWSPSSVKDVDDMYRRLKVISGQLEEHGLTHIKNQGMMIRRMVGEQNEHVLRSVLEFVEPIEGYKRKKPSRTMTLSRAPDIAQPDALKARDFNRLVTIYSKTGDSELKEQIKDQLLTWVEAYKSLKGLADKFPAVREMLPLGNDLSKLAVVGLQSLSPTVKHDTSWKKNAGSVIAVAERPKVECEIKIIPGIQELVSTAK